MASTISEFAHLQIPLEDVVKATNNFAEENIIGRGDFGYVYEGKLLVSGELLDISARRLDRRHGQGGVEFWTEISMLSVLKNDNIVSMIGFCDDKYEKVIIYHYYANGSLSMHLNDPTLTWRERLMICATVAEAIWYIHYEKERSYCVIHRAITSSTILLDKDWEPYLSGFEYSIKHSVDRMNQTLLSDDIDTRGYMDPAIEKTGGVTRKSDVYSFGVVLFEVLCGRRAFIPNEDNRYLGQLAKSHYENGTLQDIIHPDLWNQMDPYSFQFFSRIAYSCLEAERPQRPNIEQVYTELLDLYGGQSTYKLRKLSLYKDEADPTTQSLGDAAESLSSNHSKVQNSEHLRIGLKDIHMATENFSVTCIIGRSRFGILYKAELKCFDREYLSYVEDKTFGSEHPKRLYSVIIERTEGIHDYLQDFFHKKIDILRSCKHPNIQILLGFCDEGPHMLLVYEYVQLTHLSKYLEMGILTWEKCLKINLDVARGLNYLHTNMEDQNMVIYSGISSSTIVLDDNLGAKIFEFGSSVFLHRYQDDVASNLDINTDPEFDETAKPRREFDLYMFGVIMLEVLCGRSAFNIGYTDGTEDDQRAALRRNHSWNDEWLAPLARKWFNEGIIKDKVARTIKDENWENRLFLNKGPNENSLDIFIEVARQCFAETLNQRPTMEVVITELEKALSLQENHKEPLRMLFEDIKCATQDFSHENYIGGGGFGRVYKGRLPHVHGNENCMIVAKRLDKSLGQGDQQFYSELQILYEYKHENVIDLLGYSNETHERIIVYEHASRGSLDNYLNDVGLTWRKRLQICIDVATGLAFLHGGGQERNVVIHRDIKTANILLFDDWKAKVADFGLSLISAINEDTNYTIDHVCGTKGYCDPLYGKSGFLTIESDIYSFGVVLFEILFGRSTYAINKQKKRYLHSLVKDYFEEGKQDELVFEAIKEQIVPTSLSIFQKIAYQCLHNDREKRPTSKEVLAHLKKALYVQVQNLEHLRIGLKDIHMATEKFSDTCEIGLSQFGIFYKAELKCFDREYLSYVEDKSFGSEHPKRHYTVIIERMTHDFAMNEEDDLEDVFHNKIDILRSCKHQNIHTLLGFCDEGPHMLLVYEYVQLNLLIRYLQMDILTWEKCLKICLDVAHGLNYLHTNMEDQKMVIYSGISSLCIRLDDNLRAKICEFGSSVFLHRYQDDVAPNLDINTDPEIDETAKPRRESDLYMFGVIMLEVLCGRSAFHIVENYGTQDEQQAALRDNHSWDDEWLAPLARRWFNEGTVKYKIARSIVDENWENRLFLKKGYNENSMDIFIKVARQCFAETLNERPTMEVVITELEKALSLQENHKDPLKMSFEDIKFATQDFSCENEIGGGSFGRVYKGTLPHVHGNGNHTIVAKRLDTSQGAQKFYSERQILYDYKHENVIDLLGYCNETHEKIIVYEHASRGSLDKYLNDVGLTWRKRLQICIDIATGLAFLHGGGHERNMVIHRDIKTANILLFDDWKAKIANFWLSMKIWIDEETNYVADHVCGTEGYCDPLYTKSGFLTIESDIYSFGVVLFEILFGRSTYAIYKQRERFLHSLVKDYIEEGKQDELVFEAIKEQIVPKSLSIFQTIAYQCLHDDREKRPTSEEVLAHLKNALDVQEKNGSMSFFENCCPIKTCIEYFIRCG